MSKEIEIKENEKEKYFHHITGCNGANIGDTHPVMCFALFYEGKCVGIDVKEVSNADELFLRKADMSL